MAGPLSGPRLGPTAAPLVAARANGDRDRGPRLRIDFAGPSWGDMGTRFARREGPDVPRGGSASAAGRAREGGWVTRRERGPHPGVSALGRRFAGVYRRCPRSYLAVN